MEMTANAIEYLSDFVPVRVYWRENQAFVDWCFLGNERFAEPFFEDTINRLLREPFNLLFRPQTPVEVLGELYAASPGIAPTGFIFHLSRCGSTLVSQMFAALGANIIVSEPPPIDSILRANSKNPNLSETRRAEWLRWIISALGQKRNAAEKYFYIKFDSWSTLDLALIKRVFPDVPWIFLYRNPIEVIVSHLKSRGAQMTPGLIREILPDLDLIDALQMPPEEYCARVLARICESALENLPHRNGLVVEYTELPAAVTSTIAAHFRVSYTPEEIELMNAAAQFNAKTPQFKFTADGETKRRQASEAARRAAADFVEPLYARLKSLRREQTAAIE